MNVSSSDPTELALRAFIRASGLFRNKMEPYFSQYGISGAQWGILRVLTRAEEDGLKGLRLTDLGQRLLVRPPSVTTVVDRLERAGLVRRQAAPGDQRAKEVQLTAAGRDLVARISATRPAQIRSVMSCLDHTELVQLYTLMDRFAAHLESLGASNVVQSSNGDMSVK